MAKKLLTPEEVAAKTMEAFAAKMEVYTEFLFLGGGVCKVCRDVMATVRENAQGQNFPQSK